jgi:ribokinase
MASATEQTAPILVIGSINMDLVVRTPRLPGAGETILGTRFQTVPGGKGANQAVAASRLGGQVYFVGRVGDDDFGHDLIDGLVAAGVRTEHVAETTAAASGCAVILVDERGENSIVVLPGANGGLSPADVDAVEAVLSTAACAVLQLEVPIETVVHAVRLCRRLGVYTILDPAPVPPGGMAEELFAVDLLTPNESEARALLGWATGVPFDPPRAAAELKARGAKDVVIKLGGQGAFASEAAAGSFAVPAHRVNVVDTTAAGDAFTAGLAVARAEGRPLPEAVRLANAAGALCCRGLGAQPSLPMRGEVEALLAGLASA